MLKVVVIQKTFWDNLEFGEIFQSLKLIKKIFILLKVKTLCIKAKSAVSIPLLISLGTLQIIRYNFLLFSEIPHNCYMKKIESLKKILLLTQTRSFTSKIIRINCKKSQCLVNSPGQWFSNVLLRVSSSVFPKFQGFHFEKNAQIGYFITWLATICS